MKKTFQFIIMNLSVQSRTLYFFLFSVYHTKPVSFTPAYCNWEARFLTVLSETECMNFFEQRKQNTDFFKSAYMLATQGNAKILSISIDIILHHVTCTYQTFLWYPLLWIYNTRNSFGQSTSHKEYEYVCIC